MGEASRRVTFLIPKTPPLPPHALTTTTTTLLLLLTPQHLQLLPPVRRAWTNPLCLPYPARLGLLPVDPPPVYTWTGGGVVRDGPHRTETPHSRVHQQVFPAMGTRTGHNPSSPPLTPPASPSPPPLSVCHQSVTLNAPSPIPCPSYLPVVFFPLPPTSPPQSHTLPHNSSFPSHAPLYHHPFSYRLHHSPSLTQPTLVQSPNTIPFLPTAR